MFCKKAIRIVLDRNANVFLKISVGATGDSGDRTEVAERLSDLIGF